MKRGRACASNSAVDIDLSIDCELVKDSAAVTNHSSFIVFFLANAALGSACSSSDATGSSTVGGAGNSPITTTAGGGGSSAGDASGGSSAGSTSEAGANAAGSTAGGGQSDASGDAVATPDVIAPGLAVSPLELIFSGVQNTRSAPQTISLKNPSMATVQIESVTLDTAALAFELMSGPKAGSSVAAGDTATAQVVFHPTAIGVFQGGVNIKTSDPVGQKTVGLFGLSARALEGENEPPLKLVVDTLGFAIDVGGSTLSLGTGASPIGDEVPAFRFKASGAMPVELIPVARYSPQELIPYGYYTAAGEVVIGTIAADQNQTLYPMTQPGAKSSFDAPAGEFGIFTASATHKTYSEDPKNAANQTKHAVRTYPLKNRQGMAVANAYLICMEEAANGDYQDYVFELANVVPVAK